MVKYLFLFFFLANITCVVSAQNDLEPLENEIVRLQSIMASLRDDEQMKLYNDSLRATVITILNSEGAFDYPFEKVRNMSILKPKDDAFRIFNWNIPMMDQTHDYECFLLQVTDRKKGIYNWTAFHNTTPFSANVSQKYLTPEKWQGALYYDIIELSKGKKTYYTLLGWDGANGLINRKVIEILQLNGDKIRLGAPVFKTENGNPKRYELAYSDEVMVSLKFDQKEDRIVFDHLAARSPGLEGNPAFMGPDLSFDAFLMEKGKWIFAEDVYVTMGKDQSNRPYFDPRKR